jgi:hypothetical protein
VELINWLRAHGVEVGRLVWIGAGLIGLLALWSLARVRTLALELREVQGRMLVLENHLGAAARAALDAAMHDLVSRTFEPRLEAARTARPGLPSTDDEVTRVVLGAAVPSHTDAQTSITQLVHQVGVLAAQGAQERFDDAATEVVEPRTHVLSSRARLQTFGSRS